MTALRVLFASLVVTLAGCADDPPPAPPSAMLAGPFASAPRLEGADSRAHLPTPLATLDTDATGRFYWFVPEVPRGTLAFEVRAELTPLEPGSVIHRIEETVGVDQRQGLVSFGPADLNRGGTRRGAHGAEWLRGSYSLRMRDGDRELAMVLFVVD